MKHVLLACSFYVLLVGETLAQCCGHWQKLTAGSVVNPGPCTAFQCYIGDGVNDRHIDTDPVCQPDVLWIKSKDITVPQFGVWRSADMAVDQSIEFSFDQFGSNHIKTFDATGFTVGTSQEVNFLGREYCYYAFKAAPGFFEYGQYVGTGLDDRQLLMDNKPSVFVLQDLRDANPGTRIRTADMPTNFAINMIGTAFFPPATNDIQDFMSVGDGDAFTGVELGEDANTAGIDHYWFAWYDTGNPATWVFHGQFTGTGVDGDDSQFTVNTPCASRLLFTGTVGDWGGGTVAPNTRFFARYFRHLNVALPALNHAQRWGALDTIDEEPPGNDGGWRQFNTNDFILGNGEIGTDQMANILGKEYYYWGLCE